MSIQVENLTKLYGQQVAVDSISFSVKQGEIVGFLGPNGAGKSTTMKMIMGYLPVTSGSIKIKGIDIANEPLKSKQIIGYLPEHNPLYLDMYIKEFLSFIGELYGISSSLLKLKIQDVIELVGLVPEQNKKIGQLSKGFRQRVGLAQALIHQPEILILDEPTTGLDPNQIVEIREVIRAVGKNKSVLFSSHIMQEVEALCDRIIIINHGKIVAEGSLAEIKANEKSLEATFRELTAG